MTRKVYPDNATRQKAYRERLKKKQRERWETLFKKADYPTTSKGSS